MHSPLRSVTNKLAETLRLLHFPALLYLKMRGVAAHIAPARSRLHVQANEARSAEELVDPTKPIDGPLLEEPQEPGPEDCCQSGCSLCVWDMYRDNLHDYRVQQAMVRGESPPVKALDPFEEMELKLNKLADEGKGPKAAESEPSTG
ncbi:hypothetical protein ABBQ38_010661 [Trebouxia sp. C0009 RCD-2024]